VSEQLILLLFIILIVSMGGWKTHHLSGSGAAAAVITGAAIALAFGWKGLLVLGVFFGTSSFWSKYKSSYKTEAEKKLAKTSKRDWQQVIANGGSAVLFSLIYIWTKDIRYLAGMCASLSAANADTWASEIGTLSKGAPISIRTWRSVERGTSGAVSLLGTAAGFLGAVTIGLVSAWLFQEAGWKTAAMVAGTGFLGSLIDTLLGAFIQVEYKCPTCGLKTEASIHCGGKCKKVKGIQLVNNEMVNFLASFFAGAATVILL
jgi:uncharacterized protein (TIGR00297 family)